MRRTSRFNRLISARRVVPLWLRLPTALVGTLLATEFFDELLFGLREAAWPAIRTDLDMSYLLVGLVLGVPGVISGVVEIGIGLIGDTRLRKALIVGGGVVLGAAILLSAVSVNGWMLLGATILLYPASGALVSLSQASLMDTDPKRHEHNMARWTLVGSLGVVVGTLVIAGASAMGISWRLLFAAVGFATFVLTLVISRQRLDFPGSERAFTPGSLASDLAGVWQNLWSMRVARWVVLLQFAGLMLDVLLGFLALYFVDVIGVGLTQAALAVSVWTVVGMAGDLLLIPMLDRVSGLRYLRVSAFLTAVAFTGFMLTSTYWVALILLGVLGFLNAGWYSILQAQVYTAMPGRSGGAMSVSSAAGMVGSLAPLGVGVLAATVGLQAALWALLVSPVVLLIGIPRGRPCDR